ncbi:hypothetical protein, partial [Sphingobium scionense]
SRFEFASEPYQKIDGGHPLRETFLHHPVGHDPNWSLAYPGFTIIEDHPNVSLWTEKLQHPMFAASLASDRFKMTFIFHGAHMVKLSDAVSTVSRVIYPL